MACSQSLDKYRYFQREWLIIRRISSSVKRLCLYFLGKLENFYLYRQLLVFSGLIKQLLTDAQVCVADLHGKIGGKVVH